MGDLRGEWKGSLLTLERPNQPIDSADDLAARIAAAVRPLFDEVEPMRHARVSQHALAVIRSFLPSNELVVNIDESGLADLAAIAVQSCLQPDYLDDLEIRVGYGGAPLASPNLRTAAYIVAPKQILTRLARVRSQAETFTMLDQISHPFPPAKVAKLRTAVYAGATLSEQQAALLAEIQQSIKTADPDAMDRLDVSFPSSLPRVVVYSAHEFLTQINGDGPKIHACATETLRFLAAYIAETCPPRIAARFTFDDDLPAATDPVLARQLDCWTDAVAASGNPMAGKVREKIARLGAKHAGNERAGLRYAVAHAAYSADDVEAPSVPILRQSAAAPAKLVMIGGPPEKLFWKIRQVVRQSVRVDAGIDHLKRQAIELPSDELRAAARTLLSQYESYSPPAVPLQRAQLISSVGEIPVYSAEFAGHEPSLRDAAAETFDPAAMLAIDGVRTSIKEDLVVLLQDILGGDIRDVRSIAKGSRLLTDEPEKLREAAATLRRITAAL